MLCFISLIEDRNSQGFLRFMILLSMFLWTRMNKPLYMQNGTEKLLQWAHIYMATSSESRPFPYINIQMPHLAAFLLVL